MNRQTKRAASEPPAFTEWFDSKRVAYTGRTRAQFLDAFLEGWRACVRAGLGLPVTIDERKEKRP